MSASPNYSMTPEEYLAFERASETKHEYIDGEIYAMAGAKRNHSLINASIIALLYNQLQRRIPPCLVYTSDMRVKVDISNYFYPDVTVVCGDALYDETELDMLINPALVIEILSPSTEVYDRRKKTPRYQKIESLQEYLLVAQDEAWVERYRRQPDGTWQYLAIIGLDSTVELTSINATPTLADIYENVTFEADE